MDYVARLFPEISCRLDDFCNRNIDFLDKTVTTFDREMQFYISYLEYIGVIRRGGLEFCYPDIFHSKKDIHCYETFDIVLAHKLVRRDAEVVPDDFYLQNEERVFIITGPDQGGKTTFARLFAKLHGLTCLGCPVPGRRAGLFLTDGVFTHF
ncbi:MAG: hypothetical protein DRP87_07200 [Spirochaetes bacterium]|nr:MAG: hypothetical protein DRP87_07200 [Spirochaetota bacterium]